MQSLCRLAFLVGSRLRKGTIDLIEGWVQMNGGSHPVTLRMPELDVEQKLRTDSSGATSVRSPRRVLPGVQDNYNRKGLVSDEGAKKKAFFVLEEF